MDHPRYRDAEKPAFRDDLDKIEQAREGSDTLTLKAHFTAAIIDLQSLELAESIQDPVLTEKLRQNYRAAYKRLVFCLFITRRCRSRRSIWKPGLSSGRGHRVSV